MNAATTLRRVCADCGEYNPSKKSDYCGFCRDKHPHEFVKPSTELRRARFGLAANNCTHEYAETDAHDHVDCSEGPNGCGCRGFLIAAPIHSCALCREFHS